MSDALERFVPGLKGQIKAEHFHRYALAKTWVQGKDVLDLACGEGYGAAVLAQVAHSVVGVDYDETVIQSAASRYTGSNLQFRAGSCDAVPLVDGSLDCVVSFETLEHHDRHDEMMREVKRLLRPGGCLLISSPNRAVYSENAKHKNPFHVRELSLDEFVALLRRHFRFVEVVGQKFAVASFMFPLEEDKSGARAWTGFTSRGERLETGVVSLDAPVYFVALCSNEPGDGNTLAPSLFLDNETVDFQLAQERATRELLRRLCAHPLWKLALQLRQMRRLLKR